MNVVITGASRGLGLALVAEYLLNDDHVYAVTRYSSVELDGLKTFENVTIVPSDFAYRPYVKIPEKIHLLINNAGVFGSRDRIDKRPDWQEMNDVFYVNSYLPLLTIHNLLPQLIAAQGNVINISSIMGHHPGKSGGSYPYRMSKAALNMATEALAEDLWEHKINVVAVHPGHLKTDMGGPDADVYPKTAAQLIMRFEQMMGIEDSGQFFDLRET